MLQGPQVLWQPGCRFSNPAAARLGKLMKVLRVSSFPVSKLPASLPASRFLGSVRQAPRGLPVHQLRGGQCLGWEEAKGEAQSLSKRSCQATFGPGAPGPVCWTGRFCPVFFCFFPPLLLLPWRGSSIFSKSRGPTPRRTAKGRQRTRTSWPSLVLILSPSLTAACGNPVFEGRCVTYLSTRFHGRRRASFVLAAMSFALALDSLSFCNFEGESGHGRNLQCCKQVEMHDSEPGILWFPPHGASFDFAQDLIRPISRPGREVEESSGSESVRHARSDSEAAFEGKDARDKRLGVKVMCWLARFAGSDGHPCNLLRPLGSL